MVITDFSHSHVKQAQYLVRENYLEEKGFLPALPDVKNFPELELFAENGLGSAIFEGEKMLGFLCVFSPRNVFNTDVKGVFSPIHGHGAVKENRELIYKKLYQHGGKKWAEKGAKSHAVSLYAHDEKAIKAFFEYGFGWRCADALRDMSEISSASCEEVVFSELDKAEIKELVPLRRNLMEHLGESPCFMTSTDEFFEIWLTRVEKVFSRTFVAREKGKIISYMVITDDGETFVSEEESVKNICGAFCLPEYRGKGISRGLLNFIISTLRNEGVPMLGVDYESFNPTASGFWPKYFSAYTKSLVRRIDG